MVTLIKNSALEKVRVAGALTDAELSKSLIKDGYTLSDDRFNKLLLDLEILGLVRVAWVTKDTRRVEACEEESEEAGYADSASSTRYSKESDEEKRAYEASFPGLEK